MDKIQKIIDEISQFTQISASDIPSIELYVDQVTTFIENELNCYKRKEGDKILTKTMINNYAKDKIFPPPSKKKYSKNHIIILILIFHLKSQLSMADIKLLLSHVNQAENHLELEKVYQQFVEIQAEEIENLNPVLQELRQHNTGENDRSLLISALRLIIRADLEKRMAEKIIDNYFQELDTTK